MDVKGKRGKRRKRRGERERERERGGQEQNPLPSRPKNQPLWSGLRLVSWLTVRSDSLADWSLARSFVRQRAAARVCWLSVSARCLTMTSPNDARSDERRRRGDLPSSPSFHCRLILAIVYRSPSIVFNLSAIIIFSTKCIGWYTPMMYTERKIFSICDYNCMVR